MVKKAALPDFIKMLCTLVKLGPLSNQEDIKANTINVMGELLQFMGKWHALEAVNGDFSIVEKYCDYILEIPDEEIWGVVEIE